MCGGGGGRGGQQVVTPPPAAPAETAELKVKDGESQNNKKKRRGTARLTVPIEKTTAPTAGLAVPK